MDYIALRPDILIDYAYEFIIDALLKHYRFLSY